ncbi:MAG: CHAT domain-containing protein [Chitinophagaceae bacterium]|nr:CHAT domain-containing protein [Chitinophagaceae bacterium]
MLFTVCSLYVSAQDTQKKVRLAKFRIDSVFTRNDSSLVQVAGGTVAGLQPGSFIKCFSAYKESGGVEYPVREIGYGIAIRVSKSFAECYVSFYDSSETAYPGDHISSDIGFPVLPYETLITDVLLNAVEFTDISKQLFFEPVVFLSALSEQQEKMIKSKILDDLHAAYEMVKDRPNLPESMRKVMTGGRYGGKTALQVLKDVKITDLDNFLLYVKTYPAKYAGNLFRISESFTAWVVSNSPHSTEEVKRALLPWYKNRPEFVKRIKEYKASILLEGHCSTFGDQAIALAGQHKDAEADQLIGLGLAIAEEVKDTVGKASLLVSKAQIYQDRRKFKEAIAECEKALAVTAWCRDVKNKIYADCKRQELAALIKKGYCQLNLSAYGESELSFADAESKTNKYRQLIGDEDYYYYLQKTFEYRGWIGNITGNYTKAIVYFERAIGINDTINTYNSKNKNAGFYKSIGHVYRDRGNYSTALDFYEKARGIYKKNFERQNELNTEVSIGNILYYTGDYDKSLSYLISAKNELLELEAHDDAGYASSLAGTVYHQLGKYDSAIAFHQSSVQLRKKAGSKTGQAWSWNQLGELYLVSGQKKDALAAYDSSVVYNSKIPDEAALGTNYNNIGKVYLNDENFKKAAEYFEKGKGKTLGAWVEALYNLYLAWMMMDTLKAGSYLRQCYQLSRETGNDIYTFYSLTDLSKLAYRNNNFHAGDVYYDSVAAWTKLIATPRAEAQRLDLKGYSYIYKLEVDSAIDLYKRAVAIYDTIDLNSAVWERISLSEALISKGEFKEAEAVLLEGIRIADSISGKLALGVSYSSGSFLYGLLGEFDKGMKANEMASRIYEETGNTFRQAGALLGKGTLYKSAGEYKRSIEALLAADSIYKAERTEEMRSAALNNIGVTYYNQGDYTKAIDYFNRSAKYFKPGLIDESYLLNKGNLAECYYYLGKNKEAESILLAAFPPAKNKQFNRIASGMAVVLGKIYSDAKQFGKAQQYLDTAVAVCMRSGEKEKLVDASVTLAKVKWAAGNESEAEKYLADAIKVSKEYHVPSLSWVAYYESGLLHYRQKKMEKAIEEFKNAVEIVEKNSNNVYGGDEAKKLYRNDPRKVDLYGKLVLVLAESGKTAEAWTYADRSNMTGIKELMGGITDQTGDVAKDEALEKAKSLSQRTEALAQKEAELKAKPQTDQVAAQLQSIVVEKEIAEKDFIKFSENLLAKYPDLKENFYDNVNPVDFENYKGMLPADMAVLLYVINDNKLLIFSLTNEKLGITPVDLKEDITRTIREYAALLRVPGKATGTGAIRVRSTIEGEEDNIDVSKLSFKDVSEKMYRALILPVAGNIQGKKKLCIIPNGDLANIPFQALGHTLPDNVFRYLVEDQVIFYTSRMKIFDADAPAVTNMSSFAVFGVPDQTLKYTEKEARSIAGIMNLSDGVYTEKKATEEQAKQSLVQKKYVHFATHGILNYTDYNASYLKFLPAADTSGGNNGKLTIDEIYGLSIGGCELVTLSACETAVSRQKVKGWKISPANSLLRKRVKSVVATMWKVDDEATSILMDEFYRQLNTKKEKSEALRLAQEKLSKDPRYSHPYFWGAFVLYGDWR